MSGWNACIYQCTTVQWCELSVSFRTNWSLRHLNMFVYSYFLMLQMWVQLNHHTSISSFQNCWVGSNLSEILYQAKIKAEVAAFWNSYCLVFAVTTVLHGIGSPCALSPHLLIWVPSWICVFKKERVKSELFETLTVVLANDLPEGFLIKLWCYLKLCSLRTINRGRLTNVAAQ